MNWMFRLMGPQWWACLAVATAFALVYRTSVVGAPAQARDRGAAPVSPLITNHELIVQGSRDAARMEDELDSLRRALSAERERAAILAEEGEVLQRQFDALSALTVDLLEGDDERHEAAREELGAVATDLAPVPVEAIYVRPGAQR